MRTPKEFFDRLRAAGIAVCEFNPVNPLKAPKGWEINNRDHRKILVVDGRIAFTGGINISGVYSAGSFGSGAQRRRGGRLARHIVTRGPIVAYFQRVFLDAWAGQRGEGGAAADYFPRTGERGDWTMRVVASDPEAGASEMYRAPSAIEQAERRVWLTYGYFVPDPGTVETQAAARARTSGSCCRASATSGRRSTPDGRTTRTCSGRACGSSSAATRCCTPRPR